MFQFIGEKSRTSHDPYETLFLALRSSVIYTHTITRKPRKKEHKKQNTKYIQNDWIE